jgi:hypothetical protein
MVRWQLRRWQLRLGLHQSFNLSDSKFGPYGLPLAEGSLGIDSRFAEKIEFHGGAPPSIALSGAWL